MTGISLLNAERPRPPKQLKGRRKASDIKDKEVCNQGFLGIETKGLRSA